jgi:hypothetical protein
MTILMKRSGNKLKEFTERKKKLKEFLKIEEDKLIKDNQEQSSSIFSTPEEYNENLKRLQFLNSIYINNFLEEKSNVFLKAI